MNGCAAPTSQPRRRFFNNVDSLIVKGDYNPNTDNFYRPLLLRQQQSEFPLRTIGWRPSARIQHRHAHPVQLIAVLGEGRELRSGQRSPLGWNRFVEGFFPEDQTFNPSSIGLDTGVSSYNFGLPEISVGCFSVIGATSSVPRQRVDTNWHFIDNYSWQIGHDWKFGYEFRRTTINHSSTTTFAEI